MGRQVFLVNENRNKLRTDVYSFVNHLAQKLWNGYLQNKNRILIEEEIRENQTNGPKLVNQIGLLKRSI